MLIFFHSSSISQRLVAGLVMISLVANVGVGQQPAPAAAEGGVTGVASRTVIKRQEQVKKADQLFTNANQLAADGMHADAMDAYLGAFDLMPNAPATAQRREAYFKRYQSSAVAHAQSLADQAEYEQAEATLKKVYTTARTNGLAPSSIDLSVKDLLTKLNDGGHFNKAVTPTHLRNVSTVEQGLKVAKGALEIGDFDMARRQFNEVLAIDRTNASARRGLEKVEQMILQYGAVVKDQTRATMLREIAEKWETPTPPALRSAVDFKYSDAVLGTNQANIEAKLREITLASLEFQEAPLSEVLTFLSNKSRELDLKETDPTKRGVNFIIQGAPDAKDRPINLPSISNVPLEAALKYVVQQVGMKYRVEEFAVAIIPLSSPDDAALILKNYTVPPGFLQGDGADAAGPANDDPFARPDTGTGGTPIKRITAEDFLKQRGITFPAGAFANFNETTSQLTVRNRPDQISIIDAMVLSARAAAPKNVLVKIRMISISVDEAKEHGFDVLLGQSNLGAANRIFGGGGTFSNQAGSKTAGDFPFAPIGAPVTGGLRSGEVRSLLSIDEVIARENPLAGSGTNPGPAPAIFSTTGVFTDPQFDVVLRGLAQMKSLDRLCEASVVVRPGQRATIEQVREFIYPTEYDPPEIPNQIGALFLINLLTGDVVDTITPAVPVTPANPTAFEMRKLGKYIEVDPTIGDDGRTINLSINADFSDFSGFINYGTPIRTSSGGSSTGILGQLLGIFIPPPRLTEVTPNRILMPVFDAVKETTNINIWDGNTIAIGGLISEDVDYVDDKVPVLADIPVVGRVFRSKIEKPTKRGLIIFVSSQIVDPADLPVNAPLDEATTRSTSLSPVPTPPENF